ncbi:MAG: excinuclease ABC subunit UvrA [Endomicrobium sp.]|jgi:excinuclease ABC subunit A|nr:excinuclease ABC subunit UvrA [Endomicrobium sp.]
MNIIKIRGARQNNLKNINLDIPKNSFIVITGLSGSGKSSLAFDTIYVEGQRRYVESLSSYARQFLGIFEKPKVDIIDGLSPSISIAQRNISYNPRSTVGTVTEIYDYVRLLFAKVGTLCCPNCGRIVSKQSIQQIVDEIMKLPDGTKFYIFSPIIRGKPGVHEKIFDYLLKSGYSRVRVDNKIYKLDEEIKLSRYKKHSIDILIDRIEINSEMRSRITNSVETALIESKSIVSISIIKNNKQISEFVYSEKYACTNCNMSFSEIEPRLFSFNSPFGACSECDGIGSKIEVDENLIVPDVKRSLNQGAIISLQSYNNTKNNWNKYYWKQLINLLNRKKISLNTPWENLPIEQKKIILYGCEDFDGVINNIKHRYISTESVFLKETIRNKYMRKNICKICKGDRLKQEALSVYIDKKSISDISKLSVEKLLIFFKKIKFYDKNKVVSDVILKEIYSRLKVLNDIGLGYLTLNRDSSTLSGGEFQRMRLTTQIGSGLTGVLYVLDEPSIGLHQKDNNKLLEILIKLKNLGNTLIVVEHCESIIRAADYIVDLGPGAGDSGGYVIFNGKAKDIIKSKDSLTGKYLKGDIKIEVPLKRKKTNTYLKIEGMKQFNLKNINVNVPLGIFVCVTGVSGSGKSTMVHEIIYKNLMYKLNKSKERPGNFEKMDGIENIDRVAIVTQSPISKSIRSNVVTYIGVFSFIRELFSMVKESKINGYGPSRFSFNVKGGRCENCKGYGNLKIEMQFLSDIYVECDVCNGKKFNEETLKIKYKNKNIYDVLNMTINESICFFENIQKIKKIFLMLKEIGLGYIKLGQSATTFSGGESQRIKLVYELSKSNLGKTMYILDEPTTGLHFADIDKLLKLIRKLSDLGNTVVVIEHNLDVIKTADWIIDLGPGGGEKGGKIVAEGTPEDVIKNLNSVTGHYLKNVFNDFS